MQNVAIESILESLNGCHYELEIKSDYIDIRWINGPEFETILVYLSLYRGCKPCRVARDNSKTNTRQVLSYQEFSK